MPGKSGYDFCRDLKENRETRLIPVVMITGLTDRENKIRGADEFLNKPIFAEELFARVKSLLRLKEFTDELDNAEAVLCTLALSVEARDPCTEGHCERLAEYASELAAFLGLDSEAIVALKRGGYLHDLGKIAIPDEILKKGSDLTPTEWEIMRQHPVTGERICQPLRCCRSFAITTSTAMAAVIPTACRVKKSRCWRGFSRWSTYTMPYGPPARTKRP